MPGTHEIKNISLTPLVHPFQGRALDALCLFLCPVGATEISGHWLGQLWGIMAAAVLLFLPIAMHLSFISVVSALSIP